MILASCLPFSGLWLPCPKESSTEHPLRPSFASSEVSGRSPLDLAPGVVASWHDSTVPPRGHPAHHAAGFGVRGRGQGWA